MTDYATMNIKALKDEIQDLSEDWQLSFDEWENGTTEEIRLAGRNQLEYITEQINEVERWLFMTHEYGRS